MKSYSRSAILAIATLALSGAVHAQDSITIGANVNMVTGQSFPSGDPFQRQQNEPSVAYSSRNNLHLLAGANDYRAVDVPGLPGGRETGDSWLTYFWSTNGGATWKSTMIPGYPQDPACQSAAPPTLCGYAAGADPVVRAGANGMFYYSGIVFERGDPSRSAIFVSRFIDLNNDEGGDPIRYIDTTIIDSNDDGSVFLDKSWIGVDIPRGATTETFSVVQRDASIVEQTVACGNIYVGYAGISGEGQDLRSEIRLARSADCGSSWAIQPISEIDTLNQGANIAINPANGDLHVAWRRFDTVETFLGISPIGCPASPASWELNNEWPVDTITLAGTTYTVAQAQALLGTKHRGDESIKLAYEVIAAKLNLLTGGGDPVPGFNAYQWTQQLSSFIEEAEAWFEDNPIGSDPKQAAKKDGQNIKKAIQEILQGSGSCSDDSVIETEFTTGATNAIMIASSDDGGQSFGDPQVISESTTFDQGSTRFSFRTTAYPTATVDAGGRVYVAWAARGFATIRGDVSDGDARIVISTSESGTGWSSPYAIDEPNREGHQIKPSILFAGGQLTLVFYDFRQDVSGVYEGFVIDLPEPDRLRHTVDVRIATALPAPAPVFTDYSLILPAPDANAEPANPSSQASRYAFVASGDTAGIETTQVEYMVPNFPMFADGTTPFIGDYVDIAAPNLILEDGTWRFATEPGDVQVWQAVWSDNRDVIPPPDGDWSKYVAPILEAQPSIFDPNVTIPSCFDVTFPETTPEFQAGSLYTGTRNQNIYSAAISKGVIVAAPGSNRPLGFNELGAPLQRGFVVYVQNTTAQTREFRVSLPSTPIGVQASLAPNALLDLKDIEIPPFSSSVVTVYAAVDGTAVSETIPVSVVELGGTLAGSVVLNSDPGAPDPLQTTLLSTEVHNPAILNPAILNPAILNASVDLTEFMECTADPQKCVLNPAIFNPAILNPAIFNPAIFNPAILNPAILNPAILNPAIFNPAILNPAIFNPAILNPAILNPAILNPAILNPAILNPAILNPAILNPAILNPAILNPAVLNPAILNPAILNPAILNPAILNTSPEGQQVDVTFAVTNGGNATTAYDLDLAAPQLEGLDYEVIVYRLNETPVTNGCELTTEAQQQLIFRQDDPLNTPTDGSFYLEPGEQILVTFRVRPDVDAPVPADPVATFNPDDLGGLVSSQPINTNPTAPPPADDFGTPANIVPGTAGGTVIGGGGTAPIVAGTFSAGEQVSITATGFANRAAPGLFPIDTPEGSDICPGNCLLPGAPVMSLVARIGSGPWQFVGAGPTVLTATAGGDLEIGVNDNLYNDNTGAYYVSVTPVVNAPGNVVFTETVVTDDTDILNNGVFVVANDLGGSPNALVINGVVFGTDQGGLNGPWSNGVGDFSVDPFSADLDALLTDLKYSTTLGPVSFSIGGLTAGSDYRLQLLFSNDLNTTGDRVDVTIDGVTWVLDDWQPGAVNLIANFTASSSTVTVTFAPGAGSTGESGRAVLNGYALHEAPFINAQFTSVSLSTTTLELGGPSALFTTTFTNDTTAVITDAALQTWIDQPGGVYRAGGGSVVFCGTVLREIPPGPCTRAQSVTAGNPLAAGSGVLVPGPATARIELKQGNDVIIDTVSIPITLVDPSPSPVITAATPNPMAPGFGQLVTFNIVNGPGLQRDVDILWARNEATGVTTSTSNFVFGGTTIRLDGALRPSSGTAPATIWVEYDNGDRTNDFSMTFSATPAAPIITGVSTATACFDFGGTPIDPVNDRLVAGDWVRIDAQGLDSSTALIDVLTTQPASFVSSTAGLCPSTTGGNYWVQLPPGVAASAPFTLQIRANQSNSGGAPGDYATINLNQ